MYKSILGAISLLAVLVGCSGNPGAGANYRPLSANPSAFIAADLSIARMAQEKGQLAAFRELAHPEAMILTPQLKPAREALRGQAEPVNKMRWQPHGVIISCDGNFGLTQGAWQRADEAGHYATLWQRDDRGRLQWRYDARIAATTAAEAPDYIATKQASCRPRAPASDGSEELSGASSDHSLDWKLLQKSDGSATLAIRLWNGTEMVPVEVAALGTADP